MDTSSKTNPNNKISDHSYTRISITEFKELVEKGLIAKGYYVFSPEKYPVRNNALEIVLSGSITISDITIDSFVHFKVDQMANEVNFINVNFKRTTEVSATNYPNLLIRGCRGYMYISKNFNFIDHGFPYLANNNANLQICLHNVCVKKYIRLKVQEIEFENFELLQSNDNTNQKSDIEAESIMTKGIFKGNSRKLGMIYGHKSVNFNTTRFVQLKLEVLRIGLNSEASLFTIKYSEFSESSIDRLLINAGVVLVESNFEIIRLKVFQINKRAFFTSLTNMEQKPQCSSVTAWRLLAENNNFNYLTIFFKSHEAYFYYQELDWKNDFTEWLPLAISNVTNKFGRSWLRPLYLIVGITHTIYFICAILYCSDSEMTVFEKFFDGRSWAFLLPTHRVSNIFSDLDSHLFSGIIYFLDFLQKIISSFLIYQFIRSFRLNIYKN